MIKTVIVDDERLAREELKKLASQHKQLDIIAECSNAKEALEVIEEKRPHLIFLDIQMPGKTGFELLEELDYIPDVIFVTAYDEYAIKAFEVSALDYLLKPVEEDRFAQTVKKYIAEFKHQPEPTPKEKKLGLDDQVFLKDGDRCWFVSLNDVSLFESEGNYVRVYFESNKPLILKSLNNLEKTLDEKAFFRASRKHIFNMNWIEKIEAWFNGGLMVELKSGQKVEVSRRQAAKFKDLMSL